MIFVGIDVAKDKHDCFAISSDGEVLLRFDLHEVEYIVGDEPGNRERTGGRTDNHDVQQPAGARLSSDAAQRASRYGPVREFFTVQAGDEVEVRVLLRRGHGFRGVQALSREQDGRGGGPLHGGLCKGQFAPLPVSGGNREERGRGVP